MKSSLIQQHLKESMSMKAWPFEQKENVHVLQKPLNKRERSTLETERYYNFGKPVEEVSEPLIQLVSAKKYLQPIKKSYFEELYVAKSAREIQS